MEMKKQIGQIVPTVKVWLSKREVREYLDVSDEWIEKYLYADIHTYAIGKRIFFKQAEVDRYIEKNRIS